MIARKSESPVVENTAGQHDRCTDRAGLEPVHVTRGTPCCGEIIPHPSDGNCFRHQRREERCIGGRIEVIEPGQRIFFSRSGIDVLDRYEFGQIRTPYGAAEIALQALKVEEIVNDRRSSIELRQRDEAVEQRIPAVAIA